MLPRCHRKSRSTVAASHTIGALTTGALTEMKNAGNGARAGWRWALGGVAASMATCAAAQDASAPLAADPNPYYLGVSQGLTYDSNVYRTPNGQSDFYSSTSLLGGFDQPISRQRVFGRANVSLNRYRDEDRLNNTSYDLAAGLDWATIYNLSGNVNVGASRRLAAPAASAGVPNRTKNTADYENVDLRARWGGASLLSLEAAAGFSRVDYSASDYSTADSRQTTASLALYYHGGGPLRTGIAARVNRTRVPDAFFDAASGSSESNTIKGRNIDLLADYTLTGQITANARISYTKQTNSAFDGADFSGVTGSLGVSWQVTGKTILRFDASRDAGFDTTPTIRYGFVQTGTTLSYGPISGLYENNRVTNSVGLGATYLATAKISANAGVRYSRARLVTTSLVQAQGQGAANSTDKLTTVSLGANYAITRAWNLGCIYGHESRDVSGAIDFSYKANTVGCTVGFIWR